MPRVLNVGGGANRTVPSIYAGWDQDLLDINPNVKPDILCDAKELRTLNAGKYDAVFCSHNLEHFHRHEVPAVLAGFLHVLKRDGFAHIAVPDMEAVLGELVRGNHDINDTFYHAGPHAISFHDVIYGWGREVASGNAFYAHKTGFTQKSMAKALGKAGFVKVLTANDGAANIIAFAFKQKPSVDRMRRLECL